MLADGFANALQRRVLARDGFDDGQAPGVEILDRLQGKSEAERLQILREGLDGGGLTWQDISIIWSGFADELAVARANPDLFKKSVERAGIIKQEPVFAAMEPKFRQDVETIVLGILAANRSFVQKEMERLGVATGEATEEATPDQDAQVREMQKVANQLGG